jgi:diguanylate cyclase (GGDEF)-like protein
MNAQKTPPDSLTGLPRREAFSPQFEAVLEKAQAENQSFALGVMDLDVFKQVNDTYGVAVGDQVITSLTGLVQRMTAENVLVFRYGGDEFALIFPDTPREQAFLALERIRAEAEAQEIEAEGGLVKFTVSGGIAAYPIDGASETELMRKATQALYRAKRSGSNQVMLAFDEKMVPKTTHYTETQLERLSALAGELEVTEASLLREALDNLITKYTLNKIESE